VVASADVTRVGLSSFLAVDAAQQAAATGVASEANAPPSRSPSEGARSSETVLSAPAPPTADTSSPRSPLEAADAANRGDVSSATARPVTVPPVVVAPMSLTPARGTPLPRTPCAHEVRFVEVKLRDPDDPLADEALTPSKRTRLRACARAWLDANPHVLGAELAFLVAVVPPEALEPPAREGARDTVWLDDAFDG